MKRPLKTVRIFHQCSFDPGPPKKKSASPSPSKWYNIFRSTHTYSQNNLTVTCRLAGQVTVKFLKSQDLLLLLMQHQYGSGMLENPIDKIPWTWNTANHFLCHFSSKLKNGNPRCPSKLLPVFPRHSRYYTIVGTVYLMICLECPRKQMQAGPVNTCKSDSVS